MTLTIRQQISSALDKVLGTGVRGVDRQLVITETRDRLFAEFPATSVALTPSAGLDEMAKAGGYIKLEPWQVVVCRSTVERALARMESTPDREDSPTDVQDYDDLTAALGGH